MSSHTSEVDHDSDEFHSLLMQGRRWSSESGRRYLLDSGMSRRESSSSAQAFLSQCTETPFATATTSIVNAAAAIHVIANENFALDDSSCSDENDNQNQSTSSRKPLASSSCSITDSGIPTLIQFPSLANLSSDLTSRYAQTTKNHSPRSGQSQAPVRDQTEQSSSPGSRGRRRRSCNKALDDQSTLPINHDWSDSVVPVLPLVPNGVGDTNNSSNALLNLPVSHENQTSSRRLEQRETDESSNVLPLLPSMTQRQIITAIRKSRSWCWFKRHKLHLDQMNLTVHDVERRVLGTTVSDATLYTSTNSLSVNRLTLQCLSLSGNATLGAIPSVLVRHLPALQRLDLSGCNLRELAISSSSSVWNLPQLTHLNLSHNRLTEFPDENVLAGLPELRTLILYGNQISVVHVPRGTTTHKTMLLSNLESLDLGYNDLTLLSDSLGRLPRLRTLKVCNNLLTRIPHDVCAMRSLRRIDASSNPFVTEPPMDVCDGGLAAMRQYWTRQAVLEQQAKRDLMTSQASTAMDELDHPTEAAGVVLP